MVVCEILVAVFPVHVSVGPPANDVCPRYVARADGAFHETSMGSVSYHPNASRADGYYLACAMRAAVDGHPAASQAKRRFDFANLAPLIRRNRASRFGIAQLSPAAREGSDLLTWLLTVDNRSSTEAVRAGGWATATGDPASPRVNWTSTGDPSRTRRGWTSTGSPHWSRRHRTSTGVH